MGQGTKDAGAALSGGQLSSYGFPHLSPAMGAMMEDLLRLLDEAVGPELLPSGTPPDVRDFAALQGGSTGSVVVHAGRDRSLVDRALLSWLHCALPFGTLDFATLSVIVGPATDGPHLLLEFSSSSPHALTAVMDLLPRRDVAHDPEYLSRHYLNTPLPSLQQQCESDHRMEKYVQAPGSTFSSLISPTALLYTLDSRKWEGQPPSPPHGEGDAAPPGGQQPPPGEAQPRQVAAGQLDAAVSDLVHPVARQVMLTWIEAFRERSAPVPEGPERRQMAERDASLLERGIQADLTNNMPRLFGQEVTDQVLKAFQNP